MYILNTVRVEVTLQYKFQDGRITRDVNSKRKIHSDVYSLVISWMVCQQRMSTGEEYRILGQDEIKLTLYTCNTNSKMAEFIQGM